jgi:type IV pilus assembly protein PilM
MIARFVEVAKKASLAVDAIDLQAFALTRAVSPAVPFIDQGGGAQTAEASALVHIGSGITNLVVAAGGMPQFTRVINLGCEAIVQALVTHRGISHDEADALRLKVGLSGGSDEGIADLEADTVTEIHQTLDTASEAFADEIRRSIDYYHSQEPDGQISGLLITGEGALTRHMPEYLSEALHLPVSLGNAVQRVTENKTKLSQAELDTMAPRLAVAIGLALEDEE